MTTFFKPGKTLKLFHFTDKVVFFRNTSIIDKKHFMGNKCLQLSLIRDIIMCVPVPILPWLFIRPEKDFSMSQYIIMSNAVGQETTRMCNCIRSHFIVCKPAWFSKLFWPTWSYCAAIYEQEGQSSRRTCYDKVQYYVPIVYILHTTVRTL